MRGTDVAGALHPCLLRLLRARPRIPSTVLLVLAAAAPSPLYLRAASSMPPNRSEYQPLAQSVDEEEDVSEGLNPQPARGLRRAQRPVHIDLTKLDSAFKRYASCSLASHE